MTVQEIKTIMEGFGIPAAYCEFEDDTVKAPPFLAWYFDGDDDFCADDHNYVHIRSLVIELYTARKDFTLEGMIETKLEELDLPYEKDGEYLNSERMHMTTYRMDIVLQPIATESEERQDE